MESDLRCDLSNAEWEDLIKEIKQKAVVPVIGPSLVTMIDSENKIRPLNEVLAPLLAKKLGLENEKEFTSTTQVAEYYILNGNERKKLFKEYRDLLLDIDRSEATHQTGSHSLSSASEPLNQLALIRDFHWYIGTTPDHKMRRALSANRLDFNNGNRPNSHVRVFHPKEAPERCDMPKDWDGSETYLYQLLGDINSGQAHDFVAWEEDLVEFIFALLKHEDNLRNLFSILKNKHLLFLGTPADDWMVRFLLRAVRGERLSTRGSDLNNDYIADHKFTSKDSNVIFFKKAKSTFLINRNPVEFVNDLYSRWRKSRYSLSDIEFLKKLSEDRRKDAVFISYAKEDLTHAVEVARALHDEQIPLWIDIARITAGEAFDPILIRAIKYECVLFISLVSKATESVKDRYVHDERKLAEERQKDYGETIYYIPVLLPDLESIDEVALEPNIALTRHFHKHNNDNLQKLVCRVRQLYKESRGEK